MIGLVELVGDHPPAADRGVDEHVRATVAPVTTVAPWARPDWAAARVIARASVVFPAPGGPVRIRCLPAESAAATFA